MPPRWLRHPDPHRHQERRGHRQDPELQAGAGAAAAGQRLPGSTNMMANGRLRASSTTAACCAASACRPTRQALRQQLQSEM
ncbi:hypothetical protein LP419_24280 [Massilia sp. H-1]|nr:hypothetical protein LP419_24280 [Massilia sp. H-1]